MAAEDGVWFIERPDGRRLGYRWYGAHPETDGPVVLHNHGGLSCARDAALGDEAARDVGVRILAPDRPGVGTSDRHKDRTVLTWVDDVTALLDALDIDTATTVGWSLGGMYALVLVARTPERVTRAGIVAGCPPLEWPGVWHELNRTDRVLMRLASNMPPAARRAFRAVEAAAARSLVDERIWGPADAAVMKTPVGRLVNEAIAKAGGDRNGMVDEYVVWRQRWGFDPHDITAPVHIWQGDLDRLVPVSFTDRLGEAIPTAGVTMCPGEGHLLLEKHWPEVLTWLAAAD